MSGRTSKNKGKSFERRVGHILADFFNLEYGKDITRDLLSGGSVHKGDLHPVTPKAKKLLPYVIECKYQKNWTFEQILKGTGPFWNSWVPQVKDELKNSVGSYKPWLIFSKPYDNIYIATNYYVNPVTLDSYQMFVNKNMRETWYIYLLNQFLELIA